MQRGPSLFKRKQRRYPVSVSNRWHSGGHDLRDVPGRLRPCCRSMESVRRGLFNVFISSSDVRPLPRTGLFRTIGATTSSIARMPSSLPSVLTTGRRRTLASAILANADRTSSAGLQQMARCVATSPTVISPGRRFRVPKAMQISRSVITDMTLSCWSTTGSMPQLAFQRISTAAPKFISGVQRVAPVVVIASLTFIVRLLWTVIPPYRTRQSVLIASATDAVETR
jgi:hypothetical protein